MLCMRIYDNRADLCLLAPAMDISPRRECLSPKILCYAAETPPSGKQVVADKEIKTLRSIGIIGVNESEGRYARLELAKRADRRRKVSSTKWSHSKSKRDIERYGATIKTRAEKSNEVNV